MIVRDADLYGKMSRHWSTADPISILVWLVLAWLAMSLGGIYWPDEWRGDSSSALPDVLSSIAVDDAVDRHRVV